MYRRIEVGAGARAREGAERAGGAFQHLVSSLTQGAGIPVRRLRILFVREMHKNRKLINSGLNNSRRWLSRIAQLFSHHCFVFES